MTTQDHSGTHATLADSGDTSDLQQLPRGSNLGRYVIIEPIGSGGMGTVYRAYDPQLNRGVALKILSVRHADLGTAERAKARLIREAQALAQLSHPNVVAVHDAGTFEDDVFIAMELVEGKTLDEWLRQEKRTVKEILEVMIAAGRGLSAAHKAGLVHRDFKPGNVIVGDDGRVRVLDFGLARAVDQAEVADEEPTMSVSGSEVKDEQSKEPKKPVDWKEISSDSSVNLLQSPLTHAGGILGTPMYMAPEQHLGQKTDERTDQFGFCVVLYEALYGKRPFRASTMEKLKKEVILQRVRGPEASTNVPDWLWQIIRKGLYVKPEDRYPNIDSLLEDLDKDPEQERKQKQLDRRRKLFVVALVLFTTALPFGIWYGLRYKTLQLCKAAEGEFDGVYDEQTKASIQKAFLEAEKSFAQATWKRVEKILDRYLANWMQMRGDICEAKLLRGTQSEELFDLRMSCLKERRVELGALAEVFVEADAMVVQKAIQASSSLTDLLICEDEKALRAPYPPPATAEATAKVGAIRDKLALVGAMRKTGKYREGLLLAKKLETEATVVGYRPVNAEVLVQLGILLERTGEYKTAEETLNEAARIAGESSDAHLAANAMSELVSVLGERQERYEAGLLTSQYTQVLLGVAGGDARIQARMFKNRGSILMWQGEYQKSLEYHRKALATLKNVLGPDHPDLAVSLNNIGAVFYCQGDYVKALEYYRKSIETRRKTLGPEHPEVALSLYNIALVFFHQGRLDEALDSYQRAVGIWKNVLAPDHPNLAASLNGIGEVLLKKKDYNKAFMYLQKSLAIQQKALGSEHPRLAYTLCNLGKLFYRKGNYEIALENQEKALAIRKKALGSDHILIASSLTDIGHVLVALGEPKRALNPLERAVAICEHKTCEPGEYARLLSGLAKALMVTSRDKERPIKLTKQAQELLGKTPKKLKKELEEINTWLQKHDASKLAIKANK